MNKKMRETLAKIEQKRLIAKGFMDGETKDLEKAGEALDEIDTLQKEFDLEKRLFEAEKDNVDDDGVHKQINNQKASGFKAIAKLLTKKSLNDTEKALITGGTDGENLLIPEDVRVAIIELRKQYKSAKGLITVIPTESTSGSFNFEKGEVVGLSDFTDGGDVDDTDQPGFEAKKFSVGWFGKLIPVSRILMGAEKAGLLAYINRWFVKNAIVTENKKIFAALAKDKTAKALKGWRPFKSSINKDLDPDALIDAIIITNQTGFDILDSEEDKDGKPVLQPNPQNATQKMFQSLPIHVFSDAQLPNVSGKAPVFYGSTMAGAYFIDKDSLEFAVSEHALFGKNQTALRVIEGFDVIQADSAAYIYGTLEPTPASTTTA
ncbi:phage major capsid protein [Bacillus sp. JJ722]|uniref:phage major capsid protein n=1 Tax=Bacillus sp. JJ722 TaxID=3122973 RepID=UPI002FFF619D